MADDWELSELVEQLKGRGQRRFRRKFVDGEYGHFWHDFPAEDTYEEWRLRESAKEMLELLDRSPQAADVLLQNFLLNKPGGRKVVWFSPTHVVMCDGPQQPDILPSPDMPGYKEHILTVFTNDASWYCLTLKRLEDPDFEDYEYDHDVIHLLHKVIALGTCVGKLDMQFGSDRMYPGIVPGIRDFVSLAGCPRSVKFSWKVSEPMGCVMAYHCHPSVQLAAMVGDWEDKGEALAMALVDNQGPTRLAIGSFRGGATKIVAPALAATTRVEELMILLPVNQAAVWNAVVRNKGIRTLAARHVGYISYRDLKAFWKAALTNGAIHHIDADESAEELYAARFERDRIECTEMIATMIRSNPRITSIQYDPLAYSVPIMETKVMPIVHLNRFQPIVKATFEAGSPSAAAATGRDRKKDASALIGSPLVRRHPELLYCLLKAGREHLLLPPTDAGTRRERASERPTPKKRSRGGG